MMHPKQRQTLALSKQIRDHLKRPDFRAPYRSQIADKLRDALETQTQAVGDREPFVQWLQEWAMDDLLNDLGSF